MRRVAPADHYVIQDAPTRRGVRDAVRELLARDTGPRSHGANGCLFDDVDILVLDAELLHLDGAEARHAGESIAWLARVYAKVEVVVLVNQSCTAQFDLSLRGDVGSDADLNIAGGLLGSGGLWADPPWEGFRPWHWETLYRAVGSRRARRAWVREHWNKPIVDALGMGETDANRLSDTAFGFIAPDARDFEDLRQRTFGDFAYASANRTPARTLSESAPDAACRLASGLIGKWLESMVLAPQGCPNRHASPDPALPLLARIRCTRPRRLECNGLRGQRRGSASARWLLVRRTRASVEADRLATPDRA